MIVLALDISTSTGYAVFQGDLSNQTPALKEYGVIKEPKSSWPYPWDLVERVSSISHKMEDLVKRVQPDIVVIEEVNSSRARISQKILDAIHYKTLELIRGYEVWYISTSIWRRHTGCVMSKEDRQSNKRLRSALDSGKNKKDVGIKGKITPKHLSVKIASQTYGLDLKQKDNDISDAILLGLSIFRGATVFDPKKGKE